MFNNIEESMGASMLSPTNAYGKNQFMQTADASKSSNGGS